MKEIRFTISNSPLWHSFYFDLELVNEVNDDIMCAYLLTQELKLLGIKEPAKKVIILDENHSVIASSNDISVQGSLRYKNTMIQKDNETK